MAHDRIVGIAIAKPGIRKKNPAKLKWLVAVLAVATVIATAVKFWPANLLDQVTSGGAPQVVSRPTAMPKSCTAYYPRKVFVRGETLEPGRSDCFFQYAVRSGTFKLHYTAGPKVVTPTTSDHTHSGRIERIEALADGSAMELIFCEPDKGVAGIIRCNP